MLCDISTSSVATFEQKLRTHAMLTQRPLNTIEQQLGTDTIHHSPQGDLFSTYVSHKLGPVQLYHAGVLPRRIVHLPPALSLLTSSVLAAVSM